MDIENKFLNIYQVVLSFIKKYILKWKLIALIIVLVVIVISIVHCYRFIDTKEPVLSAKPDNIYNRTLHVVADYAYEPYSYIDSNGNYSGYDIELIYTIANRMEVNVDLKLLSWSDAEKAMEDGDADVILGVEYGAFEESKYELTIPFNEDEFICFGKNGIYNISDVFGKKITTLDENDYYDYLFKYCENNDYNTYEDAFRALSNDEIDYVIARYAVGRRVTAKIGDKKIEPTGPVLRNSRLCIGVTKGNEVLADEISDISLQLINEGYDNELSNKWCGKYVDMITFSDFIKVNYKHFEIALITILAFFVIIAIIVNKRIVYEKGIAQLNGKCLRLISERSGNAMFEWDYEKHELLMSVNFEIFFSGGKESYSIDKFREIVYEDDINIFNNLADSLLNGYEVHGEELRILDKDNKPRWYMYSSIIIFNNRNKPIRAIGSLENIDSRIIREQILEKKSELDLATGIFNKYTTEVAIRSALEDKELGLSALIIIDIDNLKHINDTFGHKSGDEAIKCVANCMKNVFRKSDIIGRVGGDEFVVFMNGCGGKSVVTKKVENIMKKYDCRFNIDTDEQYVSTLSMGVTFCNAGDDFDNVYRHADAALYSIKHTTKNNYSFYEC